jgi:hypothetical protein
MNDDSLFLKLSAAVLITLILTVGGCEAHMNAKVAQMVESGTDPLEAYCAIRATSQNQMCAVLAVDR